MTCQSVTFREQWSLAFSFACYSVTFNVMIYIVKIVLFLNFLLLSMFLQTTVKGGTCYYRHAKTLERQNKLYLRLLHSVWKELLKAAYSFLPQKTHFGHARFAVINNSKFLYAVFVRAMINADSTTIYFCPEQSKHKSQTFDGSSRHSFGIDGDIRAHFPPFRGSHPLPFIPVLKNNFHSTRQSITTTI